MLVRLIAQSHLDPVFMWPWQEGLAETIATCKSAANLLKKYPDLVFIRSDAVLYKWIERLEPALLDEIKQLAKEKRWIPVGNAYIQIDSATPSGESRIRQTLIGSGIFAEMFGTQSDVAYLPDSWGHPASAPKIMAHCGYKYFAFSRPDNKRFNLPSPLFRWVADDGSSVLAYRIPVGYSTYDDEVERIQRTIEFTPKWMDQTMCFFGLGNHGGGPTIEQIERVIEYAKQSQDIELAFSHPQRFFEDIKNNPNIPDYTGCMEHFAIGCTSAAAGFKRLYDRTCRQLLLAEHFAALASAFGFAEYDHPEFNRCWENVLFSEFHDILPGTSIKDGMEDATNMLAGTLANASRLKVFAQSAVVNHIDTSQEAYVRLVAFNNSNMSGTFYFEYEPWLIWQQWKDYAILDEQGNCVPYQQTQSAPAAIGHTRLIIKINIPANGYRLLRVVGPEPDLAKIGPENSEKYHLNPSPVNELSNKRYKICLDSRTKEITKLKHKNTDTRIATKGFLEAQVFEDKSDTWSIHLAGYQDCKRIGVFEGAETNLIEAGPLRWTIESKQKLGMSNLRKELRFFDETDLIELHMWLDWREQWSLLKLNIPLPFSPTKLTGGLPFGKIARNEDGSEFVFHNWLLAEPAVRSKNELKGLAVVAGPGIHSADFLDNAVRLTLLRSPIYCHQQLEGEPPYDLGPRHEHMEQGMHYFVLGLLPICDDITPSTLVQFSQQLNNPVSAVTATSHPGSMPPMGQLFKIAPENVLLSALKKSEDQQGYIMRLWETAGVNTNTQVYWMGHQFDVSILANQLCSIKLVSQNDKWYVKKVNGLEQPL